MGIAFCLHHFCFIPGLRFPLLPSLISSIASLTSPAFFLAFWHHLVWSLLPHHLLRVPRLIRSHLLLPLLFHFSVRVSCAASKSLCVLSFAPSLLSFGLHSHVLPHSLLCFLGPPPLIVPPPYSLIRCVSPCPPTPAFSARPFSLSKFASQPLGNGLFPLSLHLRHFLSFSDCFPPVAHVVGLLSNIRTTHSTPTFVTHLLCASLFRYRAFSKFCSLLRGVAHGFHTGLTLSRGCTAGSFTLEHQRCTRLHRHRNRVCTLS